MVHNFKRLYRAIYIAAVSCGLLSVPPISTTCVAEAAPKLVRRVDPSGVVIYEREDSRSRNIAGQYYQLRQGPPAYTSIDIQESVYIAGDAGIDTGRYFEPLYAHVSNHSAPSTLVFLGDIIYPRGLPALNHPERDLAERVFRRTCNLASQSPVKSYYIPGNHDWGGPGQRGWASILRLGNALGHYFGEPRMFPQHACPGPQPIPHPGNLQLLALDTHWWLHNHEKPKITDWRCSLSGLEENAGIPASEQLRRVLQAGDPNLTILLSHHPFTSYGPHGKPQPKDSNCRQDLQCPAYRRMRAELEGAMEGTRPLICAAGHDHALQVIQQPRGCRYMLVSGGMSRIRSVSSGAGTLFAKSVHGFMRVDRLKDGRIFLIVFTIDNSKQAKNRVDAVFSMWLRDDSRP